MLKTALTIILGLSLATPAMAVRNGTVGKYSRNAVTVKAYQYLPSQCRPSIARATSTWNSNNPDFKYNYSTSNVSATGLETSNNTDFQVDYSSTMDKPGAWAEVRYRNNTTAGYSDADMYFNANRMFWTTASGSSVGDYYCPSSAGTAVPSTKADFESIALHEFGHGFGLDHFDDSNCSMYDYYDFGQNRRTLCSAEVTVAKNTY